MANTKLSHEEFPFDLNVVDFTLHHLLRTGRDATKAKVQRCTAHLNSDLFM